MAKRILTKSTVDNERAALMAEIERLKAANSALGKQISFKVSTKGAVSVYGMGRFPVTLYREQWLRLLGKSDELEDFIEANEDKLTVKQA